MAGHQPQNGGSIFPHFDVDAPMPRPKPPIGASGVAPAPDLAELRRQLEDCRRERDGYRWHLDQCEQIAGRALGYPWYKDRPDIFPDATEADGVCIGDHLGDTIVDELATAYAKAKAERGPLEVSVTYRDLAIGIALCAALDAALKWWLQ